MLDDIGAALYKKLKSEADSLKALECKIFIKQQEADMLMETWLHLEDLGCDAEADVIYFQKHKCDLEVQHLERKRQEVLTRIKKYV
jgi:hypothetical protein